MESLPDPSDPLVRRPPGAAHSRGFELEGESERLTRLIPGLWASRDLIAILARKDFFVRYRRVTFGLLWAVALPVLQAVVLAFVVSRVVTFSELHPYTVYVLAGTTVWSFFSTAVSTGSTSIVDGSAMSTKIYFPRLVFPIVSVVANAYALVLGTAVLVVFVLGFGPGVHLRLLWLLPGMALAVVLVTAWSAVLSAVHVYFRDVRYLVQAALLAWFYVTPVFYPLDRMGRARSFLVANPATGLVELYHKATVGPSHQWTTAVVWTVGWSAGLMVLALVLHRRYDRVFADLI
jgi:ABC-type polysaccharide/polyol phosphate export permease